MKIGIVGGTGGIGEGMALRLSPAYEVIIGSRSEGKACESSECTIDTLGKRGIHARCRGTCNQAAVDEADLVVLAIPFQHTVPTLKDLTGFEEKIIISPINPMSRSDHFYFDPPPEGSAAMLVKKILPESARVVSAFNNIAANSWKNLDNTLNYSVPVCGDDDETKVKVMNFVSSIAELKAFDAGPLEVSSIVESITPLLLNIARFNRLKDVGIQFR